MSLQSPQGSDSNNAPDIAAIVENERRWETQRRSKARVAGANERYPTLRRIAFALKVNGYIVLVCGVVVAALTCFLGSYYGVHGPALAGVISGAAVELLAAVNWAYTLFGAAELIRLQIDVESNTRRAADALGAFTPRRG